MIVVYGASDDCIEIDGDVREEFVCPRDADGNDTALLAFSDGTVLRITYTLTGVWRIVPVQHGGAFMVVEQAPENCDDNYSDRVTLDTGIGSRIVWCVCGVAMGAAKP